MFVPKNSSVVLPDICKSYSPAFPFRVPHFPGRWDESFSQWHKIFKIHIRDKGYCNSLVLKRDLWKKKYEDGEDPIEAANKFIDTYKKK